MTTSLRASRGRMHLGGFFHPTGNHVAAWLHPESQIDAGVNFQHYVELAQTAERAKFDLIFVADSAAARDGNLDALKRWPQYMAYFDPTMLMAGFAAVTRRIGLVATASASFNEPYNIARRFATLDLMSGGRAGWNVVTSSQPAEAYNFGLEALPPHAERYARAREFVEVCRGLWDSWDDDAFVRDRASALYFDPQRLHYLRHKGKYFSVRGPLNVARPPQGYPVLANAGVSDTGKEFAADIAEIVFTPLHTLEQAQTLYRDLKGRMEKYGRRPEHLKIMPGLNTIVGRTDEEAEEKHQFLQSLIHPDVGRQLLSTELGIDLTPFPVDGFLPYHLIDTAANAQRKMLVEQAQRENLTIREFYLRYAGARGQRTVKGSPQHIADEMEDWFLKEGVDGFLVQPPYLPGGLNDFVDLVIPELRRRGLFRSEYEGRTLRDHLGLPRPASRYQIAAAAD
ncbi:MAG TPA: LLM class flavin-dependent oxidoreductase [Stellaceae bacterium]|nr:LLM class flavin-dependent oxidoreductase [Stellaceae bacterium]